MLDVSIVVNMDRIKNNLANIPQSYQPLLPSCAKNLVFTTPGLYITLHPLTLPLLSPFVLSSRPL